MIQAENRTKIAEVLKALGHPIRLQIVEILVEGEQNVTELEHRLQVPQAILSQQLRVLRTSGVAVAEKRGGYTYYSLFNPQLANLMQCLERCQGHCEELR